MLRGEHYVICKVSGKTLLNKCCRVNKNYCLSKIQLKFKCAHKRILVLHYLQIYCLKLHSISSMYKVWWFQCN